MAEVHICEDEECRAEFIPARTGTRFCSHRCNLRTYRRKKQERKASTAVSVPCEGPGCNKVLARQPSGVKPHNFCGRACQIAWRKVAQEAKTCVCCGKEFTPHFTKPEQQCCSKSCSAALNHQAIRRAQEHRRACVAAIGDRDVASEVLAQVSYSSLWRGKGMTPAYQPLGNTDVCVGY